jgi:hypothetical protein
VDGRGWRGGEWKWRDVVSKQLVSVLCPAIPHQRAPGPSPKLCNCLPAFDVW